MTDNPIDDAVLREVMDRLEGTMAMIVNRLRPSSTAAGRRQSERLPGSYFDGRLRAAERVIADRRRMRAGAGDHRDLFSDPAWDLLLDLYLHRSADRKVATSSACIASQAPATTALRWVATLHERGLVDKVPDGTDGRRTLVVLTDAGRLLVERMLPDQ